MNNLFKETLPIDQLSGFAKKVMHELKKTHSFILWLDAEMGSGKTTFVRECLYGEGYDRSLPVTSPTYTYAQTYEISGRNFAHLDLYRFPLQHKVDLDDLLPDISFAGIFVEWPSEGAATQSAFHPTNILRIEYVSDVLRNYRFYEYPS